MDPLRVWFALGTVFGLLGMLVWRFGGATKGAPPRRARLFGAGSLRLTPQHSVHLVETAGRAWLLGCHPAGTTLIAEMPAERPEESA